MKNIILTTSLFAFSLQGYSQMNENLHDTICDSIIFNVTVNPLPAPTMPSPIILCQGHTAILDAGSGYSSYLWSTGAVTQNITVSTSGVYDVTVSNANGCTAFSSVTVNPLAYLGTGNWPKQADFAKANTILADGNGNVYITGYFGTYGATPSSTFTGFNNPLYPEAIIDMFVLKYDASGNSWIRQFGNQGGGNNYGVGLAIAQDGGLIVTGGYEPSVSSITLGAFTITGGDAFIAKLDPCDGTVTAARSMDALSSAIAVSLVSPYDIYTAGKQYTGTGNDYTEVVNRFDNALTTLKSSASFGTIAGSDLDDLAFGGYSTTTDNVTRGIAIDATGNVYVAVNLSNPDNFGAGPLLTGASILKFNNILVQDKGINLTSLFPYSFDKVRDLKIDGAGDIYAVGSTDAPSGYPFLIVAKMPGSFVSPTAWIYSSNLLGTSIDVDNTYFYFSGVQPANLPFPWDYIFSLNVLAGKANKTNGSFVSINPYTSSNGAGCNSISHDASTGNTYIAGDFYGSLIFYYGSNSISNSNQYIQNMFAARLDGSLISYRLAQHNEPETHSMEKVPAPEGISDAVIYPNPNTGTFFVKLDGTYDKENTAIEIMDGRGLLLHKENIGKTQNEFTEVDMKMYANGVYLLRITSGENSVYRKISLVR